MHCTVFGHTHYGATAGYWRSDSSDTMVTIRYGSVEEVTTEALRY